MIDFRAKVQWFSLSTVRKLVIAFSMPTVIFVPVCNGNDKQTAYQQVSEHTIRKSSFHFNTNIRKLKGELDLKVYF
jgi:hypothetical protein